MNNWFIYIVKCNDNSLYCGITINISKRLYAHNNLKSGAKYTSSRRPIVLIYQEGPYDKKTALIKEFEIKKMSRNKKLSLINKEGVKCP